MFFKLLASGFVQLAVNKIANFFKNLPHFVCQDGAAGIGGPIDQLAAANFIETGRQQRFFAAMAQAAFA